jgi:hypothetical protein
MSDLAWLVARWRRLRRTVTVFGHAIIPTRVPAHAITAGCDTIWPWPGRMNCCLCWFVRPILPGVSDVAVSIILLARPQARLRLPESAAHRTLDGDMVGYAALCGILSHENTRFQNRRNKEITGSAWRMGKNFSPHIFAAAS